MTALRAGPLFAGVVHQRGPPGGRSFSKDRDVRTYAKKSRCISAAALYGILVSVDGSVRGSVCVSPESACLERVVKKRFWLYLAHNGAGAIGGYGVTVYLAHGGAGAYGMLFRAPIYNCLSRGGGRRRRTPSEKKGKAAERKAIPKWSQPAVETWLGRGVAEASTLRICETVSKMLAVPRARRLWGLSGDME